MSKLDGTPVPSAPELDLLEAIQARKTVSDPEELSAELTALLTTAVRDQHSAHSLTSIYHAITNTATASSLDALHVVPLLLNCEDPAAGEILNVLGECGNPKETVIAVQESLERLLRDVIDDDGDCKAFIRLERILLLYTSAISKLRLHRKTAVETLKPLFADLSPVLEQTSPSFMKEEGREITQLLCRLLSVSVSWASTQDNGSGIGDVKALCRNTLYGAVADLTPSLETHLAQQKFESSFPRLVFGKTATPTERDALIQLLVDTAQVLSCSTTALVQECSTGAMILFAYMLYCGAVTSPSPNSVLSGFLPALVASLQSPAGTDASLYIVLSALFPPAQKTTSAVTDIDPDVIPPLIHALTPLACMHTDPRTRHTAFRTLGALLARAPPLDRMHLLRALLAESAFPAMRVAAVGLLKDAVLGALDASSPPSPFASPALLQTFGSIVLRPDPLDIFADPSDPLRRKEFLESQEPRRLVECLSLYYIILLRDKDNVTCIRDTEQLNSVERELLAPLRSALQEWSLNSSSGDDHDVMSFAALETALERIDDAREKLKEAK